jgi:hypothetical protein
MQAKQRSAAHARNTHHAPLVHVIHMNAVIRRQRHAVALRRAAISVANFHACAQLAV